MEPDTILVIEDDEMVSAVIVNILKRLWKCAKYRVFTSLQESITYLKNTQDVNIIILDLCLEDSKDLQTLNSIINCCDPNTVIIVISGYISTLEGYAALAEGADAFVLKGGNESCVHAIQREVGMAWARKLGRRKRAIHQEVTTEAC